VFFGALVFRIGRWSLWADEAFSVSTSNRSFESLLKLTYRSEVTGSVYAAALLFWHRLGSSEAWLRSLSVLFMVGCVPLLFGVGRRLYDDWTGVAAVALFATNGTVLRYGQHIRFYSLVVFLSVSLTYCFVRELSTSGRSAIAWRLAWTACSALLVATHLLASPLVFALVLTRFALPKEKSRLLISVAAAIPALAVALVVAVLVSQRNEGQSLVTFHPLRTVSDVVQSTVGTPGKAGAILALVGMALVLLHSRGHLVTGSNRFASVFCGLCTAIPMVLLYIASFVRPSLLGRYVLYVVPFICLLVGAGLADVFRSIVGFTAGRRGQPAKCIAGVFGAVLLVSASAFGVSRWFRGVEVHDWRSLAAEVFSQAEPDDAIVFANDSSRLFFEYYRPEAIVGPVPLFPIDPWGGFDTGKQLYKSFPVAAVENAGDTRARLWVVVEAGLVENSFPALDRLKPYTVLRERTTSAGFVRLYDMTSVSAPP
jgi:mannosyltransferase